jgi:hypothetical protein
MRCNHSVDANGAFIKRNENFHPEKWILGPIERYFRLREENLFWSSWSLKRVQSRLRCGRE